MEVSDCRSDGYLYGVALYTDGTILAADKRGVKIKNNTFLNSTALAMLLDSTPLLTVTGNDCIGTLGLNHCNLKGAVNSLLDGNSFSNGTATGSRTGIYVLGDTTGLILGRQFFDSNITQANQITQDPASTPKLPVGGTIAVSGFGQGWTASTFPSAISGADNTITTHQQSGLVTLCLRLNAVARTGTDPLTLPDGLRPKNLTGFVLNDAITGLSYFGRILTTGVITIYNTPATGGPTALMGNIIYAA
jgi:hypothetical protein